MDIDPRAGIAGGVVAGDDAAVRGAVSFVFLKKDAPMVARDPVPRYYGASEILLQSDPIAFVGTAWTVTSGRIVEDLVAVAWTFKFDPIIAVVVRLVLLDSDGGTAIIAGEPIDAVVLHAVALHVAVTNVVEVDARAGVFRREGIVDRHVITVVNAYALLVEECLGVLQVDVATVGNVDAVGEILDEAFVEQDIGHAVKHEPVA